MLCSPHQLERSLLQPRPLVVRHISPRLSVVCCASPQVWFCLSPGHAAVAGVDWSRTVCVWPCRAPRPYRLDRRPLRFVASHAAYLWSVWRPVGEAAAAAHVRPLWGTWNAADRVWLHVHRWVACCLWCASSVLERVRLPSGRARSCSHRRLLANASDLQIAAVQEYMQAASSVRSLRGLLAAS